VEYGFEMGLPEAASSYAGRIDSLLSILHVVMIAMFVIWGVYFVYCLVVYRDRDGRTAAYHTEGERASFLPDGLVLAFELWLILVFGIPLWAQVKEETPPPADALQVHVVAQQFAWNFHYPGPDGKFGRRSVALVTASNAIGLDESDPAARDDWTTINVLHVPVDRPVILDMTSKDVIHSFQVANFRNKQDVVPGMKTMYWFQATKVGKFEIGCAQLCGIGHTQMRGDIYVDTPEDYESWAREKLDERLAESGRAPRAVAVSDTRALGSGGERS